MQSGGPPIWVAARGPRALALAARCADGWEASFLAPAAFAEAAARVDAAVATSARPRAAVGRSVELDVALGDTPAAAATAVERFCAVRGIPRTHALLGAALVGDRDAVVARVSAYARAGATDLLLAFSDFPQTTMLERFAQRVLPVLTAADRLP